MPEKIKTAVVTGKHTFEVPPFHALFRSMDEVDFYPQHLEDFIGDRGGYKDWYDVVLFYIHYQENPDQLPFGGQDVLGSLGETQQGVMVLHHGLLAFRQWPFWEQLCGFSQRNAVPFAYEHDVNLHLEIATPDHAITHGLSTWDMVDETYQMADVDADNTKLLTVDDPRSMPTVAWARTFKNARVVCNQSGHDHQTYENPNFREFMRRSLVWLARLDF